MTVAELIAELQKWDQWLPVAVSDAAFGPRPIETVQYGTWTEGPYDDETNFVGIPRYGIIVGAQ
jgi:hypothetical protein